MGEVDRKADAGVTGDAPEGVAGEAPRVAAGATAETAASEPTAPSPPRKRSWKRIVVWTLVGLVVVFGLIQLIPYGREASNPPVANEPDWDSPQTRALAKRACFDCHSNETTRWWATKIAPFSWLATADVNGARKVLNFSDWRGTVDFDELQESISDGGMPPLQYTIAHPNAKLSEAERQELIDGLTRSLSAMPAASPAP